MTGVKISELDDVTDLLGDELVEIVQDGRNKKTSVDNLPGSKASLHLHYNYLKNRENHSGKQPIETIEGLLDLLDTKVSIDTIYPYTSAGAYTVVSRSTVAGENCVYNLNNKHNDFNLHAFALVSTDKGDPLTTYIDYIGVTPTHYTYELPWIDTVDVSPNSDLNILVPMTSISQHGQTITSSSTYSSFTMLSAFKGGVIAGGQDTWVSEEQIVNPGYFTPQWIAVALEKPRVVSNFTIINRVHEDRYTGAVKKGELQGRMNSEDTWTTLCVIDDEEEYAITKGRVRDYVVPVENRMLCSEYRIYVTETTATPGYVFTAIARIYLYAEEVGVLIQSDHLYYKPKNPAEYLLHPGITGETSGDYLVEESSFYDIRFLGYKALKDTPMSGELDVWVSKKKPYEESPESITITLDTPKRLKYYVIQNRLKPNPVTAVSTPRDWVIEAQLESSEEWVTIHQVTDSYSIEHGEKRSFFIDAAKVDNYKKYRIVITAANGIQPYVIIGRLSLYDYSGNILTGVAAPTSPMDIKTSGCKTDFVVPADALPRKYKIISSGPNPMLITLQAPAEFKIDKTVDVYVAADNVRFVTPNAGSYKFLYQDHTKE